MSISAPRYVGSSTLRLGRRQRTLAILFREIRQLAGWGTWAVVALSYIAIVLILVIELEFGSLLGGAVTLASFHAPYDSPIWPYLVLLVATAVGSGCIADDLESRAIALYLSRPIRLSDYLTAKVAAVGFWVAMTAIGPALLGVTIVGLLGLSSASVTFAAYGAFLEVGLLTTVFFTALAVTLSTLTARALFAGVGIFGVILSANLAAASIAGATGNTAVLYVSPVTDIEAVANAAFNTGAVTDIVPGTAAALLIGAALILSVVTWVRLSRVEVVGE
ncbi:MAG TPA: hypothetical protein VEY07_06525 [Thermoplasmata archaeon]|nr:hypothetical protein [Thermoplasmata archaeon]